MNTDELSGLLQTEVTKRRGIHGYNQLSDREKKNFFKIVLDVIREPMIFLLIAVVVVYFLLGDRTEAIVLSISVIVIIGIELYQNNKTEKALEALRNFASPSCTVIREGRRVVVPSRELVPGDILIISEGERVSADGRLVHAESIMADESILTGESVPVEKNVAETTETSSMVYSGTMIVKGHGMVEVTTIGTMTEIGKIGSSLAAIKQQRTLLQKEVDRMVQMIAVLAIAASVVVALSYWLLRGDLLRGFLAGLTLSIAILPEEFPVVLAVIMALGAWRLAKTNVLTRKSQAIETLGSASVLCTDKTGTLTKNIMHVETVADQYGNPVETGSAAYADVIRHAVLASQVNPFDPMEEAFLTASKDMGVAPTDIYEGSVIAKEYPLEETSLSVGHVWAKKDGTQTHVALKGAPEAVFTLCKLDHTKTASLQQKVAQYAKDGLRVLAVASAKPKTVIPKTRQEYEYTLLGFVALADPIRPEAAGAVKLCRDAGIRVIMITGDYAETARRIGAEIGLDSERVITGDEFAAMSVGERDEAIKTTSIFSRVIPAQKLLIVNALKDNGEVVAMTGDGVNDAPALKSAHIGVAMGKRGTDVAREAASIVLLDDNFASIVQGVRVGRRIFANLQKAMTYLLVVHMPIITLSLFPVFFGWPLVLLPIHIVFIEFIIDPSCTLIFESEEEEPDTMRRPPRQLGSALFSRAMLLTSVTTGAVMSTCILIGHWVMLSAGWPDDKARAVTFLIVIASNVLLILAISGGRVVRDAFTTGKTRAMPIVAAVVISALSLIYTIEPLRNLFRLGSIGLIEASVALLVAAAIALIVVPIQHLARRLVTA